MVPSPNSQGKLQGITRIVFTGDVFRVVQDEREPNQFPNVFWLYNLFSYQLAQIAGIIPEICFRTRSYESGNAIIREAYKVLGLETSAKGWQNSFWHEDVPNDLIALFRSDYDQALVFAFELSPIMECILNRLGCPWVDVAVSPIRFLDDLLLSIRLSSDFSSEPLRPFAVPEKDIRYAADYVRHWFQAKGTETHLEHDDVVFFGQTNGDRTLITYDGSLFSAEVTVAALADLVGKRRLWIKPHPYALENQVVQSVMERLGGELINENAYGMLSADVDIDVVTISSSVGLEAPWFGKRTQLFYDCVLRRLEGGLTIRDSYCFSEFWSVLLEQIMPVSAFHRTGRADVRHPAVRHAQPKPNALRGQLGFWGMPPDVWADNTSTSVAHELEHARAALNLARGELHLARGELNHVRSELQHACAEIGGLRASTSWRVTAPLRRLSSCLKWTSKLGPVD